MKGPYQRLKYDLRRVWECPECGKQLRTDGATTVLVCPCQTAKPLLEQVTMKLSHDGPLLILTAAPSAATR